MWHEINWVRTLNTFHQLRISSYGMEDYEFNRDEVWNPEVKQSY